MFVLFDDDSDGYTAVLPCSSKSVKLISFHCFSANQHAQLKSLKV